MKLDILKHIFVFFLASSLTVAAQGASPKLAVYVFGTIDANLNKALSSRLLAAMVQGGTYTWIENPESFQTELASKKNVSTSQISQAAKQRGADFVCIVNLIGASEVYSISANLMKTLNSQTVKNGSLNRPLKSLDDLTAASNELAKQLLSVPPQAATRPLAPPPLVPPPAIPAPAIPAPAIPAPAVPPLAAAPKQQCQKTYSIKDIVSGLENSFPAQLKDCSSKAKEMNASKRKNVEKKDTKVFMNQCATDVVKKDLPENFPGTYKVLGLVENFMQNYVDGASIDGFLSEVKKTMGPNECVVEPQPVAPPIVFVVDTPPPPAPKDTAPPPPKEPSPPMQKYLGFRTGINFSHLSATAKIIDSTKIGTKDSIKVSGTYDNVFGFQAGVVLDIAPISLLHIQPGLMYAQKGTKNNGTSVTAHYFEVPLLFSLQFSIADNIKLGPYFGPYYCIYLGSGKDEVFAEDFGLNFGLGTDIGMFYIGAFYEYGLFDMSYIKNFELYNRTLGFNIGVNL